MENNSESLSLDRNIHYEIPLSSCSNLHLFKQLQIFLQQNNIPIQITTSIPIQIPHTQKGGDSNTEKESKSLVYQSEYTPFTIFQGAMDRLFLQKRHENTEDTKNKQLLDSMFSKDKSKKEIIQSIQTLSKQTSREEDTSREKESSNIESVIKEESSKKNKKKKLSTSTLTKTLYMHIKTSHNHPIDSIKGTKLYYLYQRQQNAQCAQFV
jgi:uncharacterized membrane-anchored protein YjiN (DUF445 family)